MKVLETPRLLMRHFESADLPALYALYRDPEMRRWYPDGTRTLAETAQEVEWHLHGHPEQPEVGLWATVHKATQRFIGRCGLLPWTLEGRAETEVAFMIAKDFWNQGLGTEAAAAIAQHAFTQLGRQRLICLVVPGNDASRRVAQKIGMRHERDIHDEYGPSWIYAMGAPGCPAERSNAP